MINKGESGYCGIVDDVYEGCPCCEGESKGHGYCESERPDSCEESDEDENSANGFDHERHACHGYGVCVSCAVEHDGDHVKFVGLDRFICRLLVIL